MQQLVRMERHGEIAVIIIDNPPVNALSHGVRTGLLDILPGIEADEGVLAILLICTGSTFSAGADVRELAAPPKDPVMAVALAALDASAKLTVAAIHGQALGGGLETALVFDYRCALASAKLGLPEIKLGLLPGGGGTQRLPRLIGVAAAADMILSGDAITAEKALALGIVDQVIEGELLEGALGYARGLLRAAAPRRRLSAQTCAVPDGFSFAARRATALKAAKGLPAAGAIIDALQAAVELPFADGLAEEKRVFMMVRHSAEAAALRHLFAAEREVAKIPGLPKDLPVRVIESAAVIGAGTMGCGIAIAAANAGICVSLIEVSEVGLNRGWGQIKGIFDAQVKRGRLSATERDHRLGMISPSLAFEDAGQADIVIECAFEDMAVKQDIFERLGAVAKAAAVLATNTSGLDVNLIAAASLRPADVLGLHFFSPANVMRLVEVVRGDKTAPEVLATAMALCKRLGKIGVLAGVCDGFIGNRMLRGYRREAEFLVLEGASPETVDRVLVDFGMAMGLHAMGDMAGLDIAAAGRRRLRATGQLTDPRVGALQDRLVELGRLGLKSGRGIYRYESGSRVPLPDPELEPLVAAEAARLGVARRAPGEQDILYRCLLPLVNEGAKILAEGIALGAADIDVIYCNGYGFPRHRGGPMFWADHLGLNQVMATMERFAAAFGPEYWAPAPLLAELAAAGKTFSDRPRG